MPQNRVSDFRAIKCPVMDTDTSSKGQDLPSLAAIPMHLSTFERPLQQ